MGGIRREHVYGNFKNRSAIQPRKKRAEWKPRAGMSKKHLQFIRALPCIKCMSQVGVQAHHLKEGTGERGAGMRSTDRWAVPLCGPEAQDCHGEVERIGAKNEIKWFNSFGIDPHELARGLWTVTNDRDRMLKVLLVHKERADG